MSTLKAKPQRDKTLGFPCTYNFNNKPASFAPFSEDSAGTTSIVQLL